MFTGHVHKPVMVRESVGSLAVSGNGIYVDGTFGAGGHALAILKRLGPAGRLVGLDRDSEAVSRARRGLASRENRLSLVRGSFAEMVDICARLGIEAVDGVLLDLGISSMQLGEARRGFSFMKEGPLDMRMDREQDVTAAGLLRSLTAAELAGLIGEFGEDRFAGRIARAVKSGLRNRAEPTTTWLADLVCRVKGGRRGATHPATLTFQALRIAVNGELDALDKGLEQGITLLKRGGRMAVISYHSLEDRRVKRAFGKHVGSFKSLQQGGRCWTCSRPEVEWVYKKPLTASSEEVRENPRARSAKLRVIERMEK